MNSQKTSPWFACSLVAVAVFCAGAIVPMKAVANDDDTVAEKVGEAGRDTGKEVKKGYRAMKDKTCEMVNGKMECAGKKLKHKAENAGDEISDKADDVKRKVNKKTH